MKQYRFVKFFAIFCLILYITFVADIFIFPTKSINEKVNAFKPKSIYAGKHRGWVLHYYIYSQSGKMYEFVYFPEELMEVNSDFIIKKTLLFSINKTAVTNEYIYEFGSSYYLFPITIFLLIGFYFFYIYSRYVKNEQIES